MSKRGKILFGVGGGVLLVLLIVVSASAKGNKGVDVRIDTVGRRDLVAAVTASGKIQPKKKVDISADITGRITEIAVKEGDWVTQGQFLLQIDQTIYQAAVQQAQAGLASSEAIAVQAQANRDQAERALGRTKELRTQNPNLVSAEQAEQAQTAFDVADANFNSAKHQVDQARANVQSSQDNLRKTHLVAPMSGRVTRLAVEPGEVAVPSSFSKDVGLLMTISDLSVIQTKVQVDETDVVRLHLGDSVEVSIDAFPDSSFAGRVTKISDSSVLTGTAAATSGQNTTAVDYDVEVTLNNPPANVRPDLSATARIVTDTRKQALSIPIIALTQRDNKPVATEGHPADTTAGKKAQVEGVFVVTSGKATFRPVKVGIAGDQYFEVLDGLKGGETIVAGPYQAIRDLKDGAPVHGTKVPGDSGATRRAS
ncbi:MAG TPA: efflux RND transporter periplasmic adaptor subunit [Gemmatimonadales bacterium]|jgi:HlyD family secretion protein|nr:efflux RND transporter periplasmic adaptor subunit [Gemmatimonadales bacterium]